MRILKFRAYSKVLDLYSKPFSLNDNKISFTDKNGLTRLTTLANKIVHQFTGLKDVTGREIYESDVLTYEVSNQLLDNSTHIETITVAWQNVGWNLNKYTRYTIINPLN